MSKVEELIGKEFGKLRVVSYIGRKKDSMWLCECSCDNKNQRIVFGKNLKNGHTKSCGCLKKETLEKKYKNHARLIGDVVTKICYKCKKQKNVREFSKSKNRKDGYAPSCRMCARKYYSENRFSILDKCKEYKLEHKEKYQLYDTMYYKKNFDKINLKKKVWVDNNREHIREYRLEYYKKNISAKIANTLRNSINQRMSGKYNKSSTTESILGISFDGFILYIENQFRDGMTWMNYGKVWHLDHFIPCASFNFEEKEQILDCFHYTNIQPLFADENMLKKDKLPDGTRGKYYA